MKTAATFSELLQAYFTERLMQQRNASPLTIANYRDTFRLLIAFAHRRLKRLPTALTITRSSSITVVGSLFSTVISPRLFATSASGRPPIPMTETGYTCSAMRSSSPGSTSKAKFTCRLPATTRLFTNSSSARPPRRDGRIWTFSKTWAPLTIE